MVEIRVLTYAEGGSWLSRLHAHRRRSAHRRHAVVIHHVLRHLFQHAWSQGAVAAIGRMEPRFLQAFSDAYCVFHRRGPWMLVNSRRPELVRSFQTGDASFSRLDGEWCLGFQGSRP
jgi:hypothetical protein